MAATAKLQSSHTFDCALLGNTILQLPPASSAEAMGTWKGKSTGCGRSAAEAYRFNGVMLQGNFVAHSGRGLIAGVLRQRCEEALADLHSFTSGLQLSASRLGS